MDNLKVVFITSWLDNPYKELLIKHLSYKGVKVEVKLWSIIFIPQVVRLGKPDILHLHTLTLFLPGRNKINRLIKLLIFISQIFILKLIGIQTVWTVHEWHDKVENGKHNISPWRARIIGKFLRAIITHCDTTKQEITQAFNLENEDKVFMVPHGNYIGYYKNEISRLEARKFLGIPEGNFIFLLLGNIYRYKGALETIDAFQHLQQKGISLVIAGRTDEEQLQEMIIDKIRDYPNILFAPRRVPEDEIQIYMNACDCVVLPYKVFTTSGVALLAMSFGRACIAPNVGFFSDVLDESRAILYDSTYEEGLLDAMKCAIEKKKDILEMGKYNLKLAEQWNWNYVADETLKIYKWCLGR